VPNDLTGYNAYARAAARSRCRRTSCSRSRPRTPDGRDFALHPAMPELRDLFGSGRLAILANVGTLVVPDHQGPVPKQIRPAAQRPFLAQRSAGAVAEQLPDSKLFTTGWGGRLADLTNAFNENNKISMSISLAGQNSFQVGKDVTQYAVSPNGAIQPNGTGGNLGALRAKARRTCWNRGRKSVRDRLRRPHRTKP
jgi:uncharacterized protein (DUF1501 family)